MTGTVLANYFLPYFFMSPTDNFGIFIIGSQVATFSSCGIAHGVSPLASRLCLYKLISGYGEAPFKAGFWLLFFLLLPLILLYLFPYSVAEVKGKEILLWTMPSVNILQNWLHFFPLVKLPNASCAEGIARLFMLVSHVFITIQAALFGFALRNRFRH